MHLLILRHGLEGRFILIPFAPNFFHQPRDFRLFDLRESSAAGVREGRVASNWSSLSTQSGTGTHLPYHYFIV